MEIVTGTVAFPILKGIQKITISIYSIVFRVNNLEKLKSSNKVC